MSAPASSSTSGSSASGSGSGTPLSPLRLDRTLEAIALAPAASSSSSSSAAPEDQTKEIAPFLRSLRRMLDRESDAILCWTTDGRAFEIHDMEVMTSYILPKYFKHAKYTSFQRQLNYFNFRKWTKSRATVCTFSNAFFVRDEPDLTWRITRKRGLSDAKSAASGGDSLSPRSPKTPKPRAATVANASSAVVASPKPAAVAAAASASSAAYQQPAPKRETPVGSKRKAPSSSSSAVSARKAAKSSGAAAPVKSVGAASAADAVDSLEWVDTLYPSLEALEAECSVTAAPSLSLSFAFESGSYAGGANPVSSSYYAGEQVPYAWPQYSPAAEDGERLRLSSAAAFFAPTVVQTSCVAL